jgi:hypothetical protein
VRGLSWTRPRTKWTSPPAPWDRRAVNDVDAAETAYAHRHQELLATVPTFPPSAGDELDEAFRHLEPNVDGAYQNFESRPDERSFRHRPALVELRGCPTAIEPPLTLSFLIRIAIVPATMFLLVPPSPQPSPPVTPGAPGHLGLARRRLRGRRSALSRQS